MSVTGARPGGDGRAAARPPAPPARHPKGTLAATILGSSLAFSVLVCLWIGHTLDKKFGTEPRYFLVGAVVGVVAASLHFWQMYRTMTGGKK